MASQGSAPLPSQVAVLAVAAGAAEDAVPAGGAGDVDRLAAQIAQADAGGGQQPALEEDPATRVERGPGLVLEAGHRPAAVLAAEAADRVHHDRAAAAPAELEQVGAAAADVGPGDAVVDVGLKDRVAGPRADVDRAPGIAGQVVELGDAPLLAAVEDGSIDRSIGDAQRAIAEDGHRHARSTGTRCDMGGHDSGGGQRDHEN
jgi:hypothetical protein